MDELFRASLSFDKSIKSASSAISFNRTLTTTMKHARALTALLLLLLSSHATAETAVFAGGCFWCVESDFEKIEGVSEAISGFAGGTLKNPTYNGDHSGHYEVVEVHYDPDVVSYEALLHYYWRHIDPFDAKGQFCDKGSSYRSAIFVADEAQRKLAETSLREVARQFPDQTVATRILDAGTFYPIQGDESYHQNYYKTQALKYKFYRWNCGRDQRVEAIWGAQGSH
jgi:peptide-methionine (S)-S-oxide reductase